MRPSNVCTAFQAAAIVRATRRASQTARCAGGCGGGFGRLCRCATLVLAQPSNQQQSFAPLAERAKRHVCTGVCAGGCGRLCRCATTLLTSPAKQQQSFAPLAERAKRHAVQGYMVAGLADSDGSPPHYSHSPPSSSTPTCHSQSEPNGTLCVRIRWRAWPTLSVRHYRICAARQAAAIPRATRRASQMARLKEAYK